MGSRKEPNWHVQVSLVINLTCLALTFVYSFTGLNTEQCKALAQKAHIYMTMDGRISMAGLNGSNIEYFAQSVDAAVRGNL
jgi:hypothetical protein